MPKYNLLVFTLLLGFLSSTVYGTSIAISPLPEVLPPACENDQYLTPAGCWSSCSASKYDTCGDVFPALYNPSYCGYTEDGRYISYTYECQACKSTGIVAVRSGACDCSFIKCGFAKKCLEGECVNIPFDPINLCLNVECPRKFVCQNGKCIQQVRQCTQTCLYGYKCKNGICIPDNSLDKCAVVKCMEGYTCKNGSCIKNSVCKQNQYETPSGCWSSCSSDQFSKCADFYPLLYNPSFCAYTVDGRYVSYTFSCQACKNTEVLAVRDGACDCSFMKCGSKQQCLNGQCVDLQPVDPVDPCWLIKCGYGTVCQNGKCVAQTIDKCAWIKCVQGYTCIEGTCVPNVDWSCALVRCAPGYICIKGKCVSVIPDLCQNVLCLKGSTCKLGVCFPDLISSYPCSLIKCTADTTCQNGVCVPIDKCALVRCMQGYYCLNGNCYPQVGLCGTILCPLGSICRYGKCVPQIIDLCATVKCAAGSICQGGICIPQIIDLCSLVKCSAGSICQNGICVPQVIDLCATVKCSAGFVCQNGLCVPQVIDLCATVKCSAGFVCQNGLCVKDTTQICQATRSTCTLPRPTEKTCPTRYYFVAPTSNFCGITVDGKQIGFPQECDACKNTKVQYYWNKPCDQLKPCLSDSVCTYDWQCQTGLSCENSKCVNKCHYVKCYPGSYCSNGACIPDIPTSTTPTVSVSLLDLCADVVCIATSKCVAGVCVPIQILPTI